MLWSRVMLKAQDHLCSSFIGPCVSQACYQSEQLPCLVFFTHLMISNIFKRIQNFPSPFLAREMSALFVRGAVNFHLLTRGQERRLSSH